MRKLNIFFLVILGIWGAVNTWLRGTSALALAQNGVVFSLRVIKLSYLGQRSESRMPLARVLLKISPKWRACSQATIQVVGVGWGGICLFSLRGCLLPYMGYIGMRHCEAYGFQVVYSGIGCISQRV